MKLNLAVKQAVYVLIASLCCGILSSIAQVYFDLQQVRISQSESIERSVDLHRDTLGRASYNLDEQQANDILASLIRHPLIKHAQVLDDFGDVLGVKERSESYVMTEFRRLVSMLIHVPLQRTYSINVSSRGKRQASLEIAVDESALANGIASRVIVSIGFSIFFTLILSVLFLGITYHYISMPVIRISQWIRSLNTSGDIDSLPYTKEDELGLLVQRFREEWHANQSTSAKLSQMLEEVSRSERFSRLLMENSSDAMFLCLPNTEIFLVNNRAESITGCESDQLTGESLAVYSQLYSLAELKLFFKRVIKEEILGYEDVFLPAKLGQQQELYLECRVASLLLDGNDYVMVNARDVTERVVAEQRIHQLAYYDSLTQLANRRLFSERLESGIQSHLREEIYGAVFYFDLDRFKNINDSMGHSVGDSVLCEVANRIRDIAPDEATCGRLGGDEFVLALPHIDSSSEIAAERALLLAKRLLTFLSEPIQIDDITLHTTSSIGIAIFPEKGIDAHELLRRADTAMYRAKALGRNSIQFFEREMQFAARQILQLEEGLHEALSQDQLEIWLQPQTRSDGEIFGAEVLVRWRHPEKGIVMPGAFIPQAEENGLIVDIDKWVLKESISVLSKWCHDGLPDSFKRMAINVSPAHFLQVDFVSYIIELLDEFYVAGEYIELEITENLLLHNFELAKNKMQLLRNKGITFAIDDFGTGYSSLKYLKELPLDVLKIDRSFVDGLTDGSDTSSLVEVVVTMARKLGMTVIAEGVETKAQLSILNQLGCEQFQGYLLGYPQPLQEFQQSMRNRERLEVLAQSCEEV